MSQIIGSHWQFSSGIVLIFLGMAPAVATEPAKCPPNVVFILADNLGWSDLGCYGADLHWTGWRMSRSLWGSVAGAFDRF